MATMPRHRQLLFVIADAEHVRFVRPAADNALHSYSRVRPSAGHEGAEHEAHQQDKTKLPALVAAQLNEETALYDELVLVVPPPSLDAIRHRLSQVAAGKVIGSVEKDLTKVPDHALWPHLHEWVRPVHRARLL